MANLPRFGYPRQRFSSEPRPGSASRLDVQPNAEPEYFSFASAAATNILQTSPLKERSPQRWRTSAPSSPKTFIPTYTSPLRSPAKPKYSAATAAAAPFSPSLVVRREPEHTIRSRSPPEVHQKTTLYEKTTVNNPAKTEHRASEYSSGKPHKKQQQQQSDVINMKGENVGAVMHITQSSDATEIHKIKKPSNEKTNKSSSNIPAKSFINSNFQGVNNSVMYNSSLSHRNPGLHLAFSKNPTHGASLDHDSSH